MAAPPPRARRAPAPVPGRHPHPFTWLRPATESSYLIRGDLRPFTAGRPKPRSSPVPATGRSRCSRSLLYMPLRWCPVGIYLIMLRAYGLAFAPFIVMVGVALSVVGALRRSWSIAVPAGVAAVGALADAVDFTGTEAGEHLQRVVHPGVPVRFGGYAFDWALLVWVLLAIAGAGAAIGLLVQLVVLAAGWPTSRPV